MLNLTNLRSLLSQIISPSGVRTAALFTPEGQLVSFASNPPRPKDEVRVIVGLGSEIWQETRDEGVGMVDSELGRLLVLPVDQTRRSSEGSEDEEEPLMLLAVNASGVVSWDVLQKKARQLVQHLEKPVTDLHSKLVNMPLSPINSPQRPTR